MTLLKRENIRPNRLGMKKMTFLGFCNRNIVFVEEKCHDKVTVKAPDIFFIKSVYIQFQLMNFICYIPKSILANERTISLQPNASSSSKTEYLFQSEIEKGRESTKKERERVKNK